MDVFLVKLSLILGHIATAMLPLIMNNLPQKHIHSGFTFGIKQPLRYCFSPDMTLSPSTRLPGACRRDCTQLG